MIDDGAKKKAVDDNCMSTVQPEIKIITECVRILHSKKKPDLRPALLRFPLL
jgi:hypothetical protein